MRRGEGRAISSCRKREFFIDNLLVRIHYIIVMIKSCRPRASHE